MDESSNVKDRGAEAENGSGGGRRFRGPMPFRLSPVKIGSEYDVRIESESRRGDSGVARVQGLVVFVPNGKPGESVRIRITKLGNGYATAELLTGEKESSSTAGPP